MTLRVIFLGTPDFAVPSLQALLADPAIDVLGVMTQPDRPAGRGHQLMASPVKQHALQAGLEIRQPDRLRKEPEMIAWLRQLNPDYLVTAAFGQILPQDVLDIPKLGTVNVHASLLPQYRGPNPIQWAILNGDTITGVTTMFTALEVDAGPMLIRAETEIDLKEDTGTLTQRLALLGAEILLPSLHDYAQGQLQATAQNIADVTHAPKRHKQDAWIDWSQPARQIHNQVRAQLLWPGSVAQLDNTIELKIIKTCAPQLNKAPHLPRVNPGAILEVSKAGLWVETGTEPLLVEWVQPAGKPRMLARDWANGTLKPTGPKQFNLVKY